MNWSVVWDVLADASVIIGALIFAICGIGVLKFRDVYTRLSVIGTAGGSGIVLVVFGAWLKNPDWISGFMAVGALIVLLATSAIGTILIARSALLRGTPMIEPAFDETVLLPEEDVELDLNER